MSGQVLTVEGATACGINYRTEVMFVREEGVVGAINVFWSNARIIRGNVTSPAGTPPPPC